MLKRLYISNYALIDKTEILPGSGLSIITGETGSGKSIMLDALGLVTGQRADVTALQDKTKKCIIEAEFDTQGSWFQNFFTEFELDYQDVSIFRREINPNGNSRAFINDSPVNLSILKSLASQIIDIHSQHQTLEINQYSFQINILDSFCNNGELRNKYSTIYNQYKDKSKTLQNIKQEALNFSQEKDYFNFLFTELEELNYQENEESKIENELDQLSNTEEIKSALQKIQFSINEEEGNLLLKTNEVKNLFSTITKYKPEYSEIKSRIDSLYIELKDLSSYFENEVEDYIFDPSRLEILNQRFAEIQRLKKKHQLIDANDLKQVFEELAQKLEASFELENEIEKLEKELLQLKVNLNKLAEEISKKRNSNIPTFQQQIIELLKDLGMPGTSFLVDLKQTKDLNEFGFDQLKFLFSANKGIEPQEISQIASGGELSRLMLAIKYLSSIHQGLPTIIFDEIDTGVSGEVAYKVGLMLQKMSKTTQLIAITHLPQIASKGEDHFFVFKEDNQLRTNSKIKLLKPEERVLEIAKMLSNGTPGEAAIKNAKELMA